MKEDWELPEDDLLQPTGKEWLFQGKMVVVPDAGFRAKTKDQDGRHKMRQGWTAPGQGSGKLNTDGSFLNNTEAGTGMVLRDHQGAIVAAACREVTRCRDATEAELMAIEEGVQLSLLWTTQPFTVETDCSEAVELLKESTPNTSIYANPTKEIFSELDEINAQGPIFARSFQKTEGKGSGATRRRHNKAARPRSWPRGPGVWGPRVAPPRCPSAYLKPSSRNPQYREPRYGKPYRDAAAANPISGDSGDRLRHPAGEGNHLPEDSSPPWSPPE
ncbi:hypothetical protein QYE76_070845 [Lolium multiflorum]|uniref:RNase H type-1 domain-containing protein n=1 Tax=Lolium multiflorum TaxID=4521 RepID=A0AAD8SLA5_LOLMU|nr:hypothetical protein QYE76_070845 [Lolium multiflorum]